MRKADNLPPPCAIVMKSGSLNFLEPSGPLQACNGTDLPLLLHGSFNLVINHGLKGPVLGPRCIGSGRARTQIPFIHMSVNDQYEGT